MGPSLGPFRLNQWENLKRGSVRAQTRSVSSWLSAKRISSGVDRSPSWRIMPTDGEGANLATYDGFELGQAIAAHRDDIEAALAEYEEAMFVRSAQAGVEAAATCNLCFHDDNVPYGPSGFFTSGSARAGGSRCGRVRGSLLRADRTNKRRFPNRFPMSAGCPFFRRGPPYAALATAMEAIVGEARSIVPPIEGKSGGNRAARSRMLVAASVNEGVQEAAASYSSSGCTLRSFTPGSFPFVNTIPRSSRASLTASTVSGRMLPPVSNLAMVTCVKPVAAANSR